MEMQDHLRDWCRISHRLLMDRFHTVREEYLLQELSCAFLCYVVQHMFDGRRVSFVYDSLSLQENSMEITHLSQVRVI